MSTPILKVRVFDGDTLEDACAKADEMPLEGGAEKFDASHVVQCGERVKVIIITTLWRK